MAALGDAFLEKQSPRPTVGIRMRIKDKDRRPTPAYQMRAEPKGAVAGPARGAPAAGRDGQVGLNPAAPPGSGWMTGVSGVEEQKPEEPEDGDSLQQQPAAVKPTSPDIPPPAVAGH